MTDHTQIVYEVDDGVATITLNRPDRLNAFTPTMARELVAAFGAADVDDAVRAVIVTGAGRGFCAGADLGRGAASFDVSDAERLAERRSFGTVDGVPRDSGGTVSLAIASARKPVIGAINGPAVGIGATMTLPMDIRIASDTARFGFVFARRGLVPEAASTWFLPRVVGISQAMEWVATGRVFDAAEALSGRLVSRVLPGPQLLDAARGVAREIAENTSAVSVAASRQMLWQMFGGETPWEAHRLESRVNFGLGQGADAAEGVAAFLEKRPARFPGRLDRDYPELVPRWPEVPAPEPSD